MKGRTRGEQQFKVFLSHRYRAPAANLYFWSILSEVADFQFEVDPALMPDGSKKNTSVTRLEFLIRNCDAFVGIFSQPELEESKGIRDDTAYSRLETDLAIRSRKPTLLFIDQRYQHMFQVPIGFHVEWFDHREVQSPKISPSRVRYKKICQEFCKEIAAHKSYTWKRKAAVDPHRVAIILGAQELDSPYSSRVVDELCGLISQHYAIPIVLRHPSQKGSFQTSDFDSLQWCFIDVGKGLYRTGLVGYLHGRFVPMLRAHHIGDRGTDTIAEYRSLYVGIEKGYDSDLVKWETEQSLFDAVRRRLEVLKLESTLITNSAKATNYFTEAARRKESIFLSYAGADRDIALDVGRSLKDRFQTVFNYRELGAVTAGQKWRNQIEEQIKKAEIGIQLISDSYYASRHCVHEASLMAARKLEDDMVVVQVRVQDGDIKAMSESDRLYQYLRLKDYPTIEALIDEVIKSIAKPDDGKHPPPHSPEEGRNLPAARPGVENPQSGKARG